MDAVFGSNDRSILKLCYQIYLYISLTVICKSFLIGLKLTESSTWVVTPSFPVNQGQPAVLFDTNVGRLTANIRYRKHQALVRFQILRSLRRVFSESSNSGLGGQLAPFTDEFLLSPNSIHVGNYMVFPIGNGMVVCEYFHDSLPLPHKAKPNGRSQNAPTRIRTS